MKPVNLLPESQRRRPAGDAKTSYVALGVLGALVLLVGNYVWVSNQATSRENDAAKAAVEATELEARSTEIGAYGDFAQTKEMRAASVRQLADSRFDWERLMRELALVLPAGGWLPRVLVPQEPIGLMSPSPAAAGLSRVSQNREKAVVSRGAGNSRHRYSRESSWLRPTR